MLGTFVHYHHPLYNWHHQYGVIVYEDTLSYGVSMPKFNGDYLHICKNDPNLALNPAMAPGHRASVLSNFGPWWYGQHKSIFQNVLVETLRMI